MASTPAQRDRDAACAVLDEQLAHGSLDIAEYADRYVRVAAATRADELAAALGGQRAPDREPRYVPRRRHPRARAVLTSVRVAAVVAVVGVMFVYGAWWAMWLLVPLLIVGRGPSY